MLKKDTPLFAYLAWIFATLALVSFLVVKLVHLGSVAYAIFDSLGGLFAGLTVIVAFMHYFGRR